MHKSIFTGFLLIVMQLSIGKMIKINKLETGFQNLKKDIRFLINIPTLALSYNQYTACTVHTVRATTLGWPLISLHSPGQLLGLV